MKLFQKTYFYVTLLLIVAISSHLIWFDFSSVLNFSDWRYWPDGPTGELWYAWSPWVSYFNFGSNNLQIPFLFFKSIWSLFVNLGFSYDDGTKITFLVPIAFLGFLSPFFLIKKMTNDNVISFVSALFFGTTTYFLIKQTSHLPIAFVYAFSPLIFYFFLKALRENKLYDWLIFVLTFWIGICYEMRIMLIFLVILLIYFLFFFREYFQEIWKKAFFFAIILFLLNFFWILPTFFGGVASDVSSVAGRGVFGDNLFDISKSFTLSEWSWTGNYPDMSFQSQSVFLHLWFIPIIAFSSLLFIGKINKREKKIILFFTILSLLGILLTKQSSQPFKGIYLWLYENLPGFSLFREASKFYLLTAFGYLGMLGYGLVVLKNTLAGKIGKKAYCIILTSIIVVSFLNLKPLFSGKIGTMFVAREMPEDYVVLNEFISKQDDYFRTFWIPYVSRWGNYSINHPKVDGMGVFSDEWSDFLDNYNQDLHNWGVQKHHKILHLFNQDFSNELFDVASIKYVVLPLIDTENDDNFFRFLGDNRDYFVKKLEDVDFLKKIDIGTQELVVYENENYVPHIYLSSEKNIFNEKIVDEKLSISNVGPQRVRVRIEDFFGVKYLNFSEKYNSNWRLSFYEEGVFKKRERFLNSLHFRNSAKMNSFIIDAEYIKKNFPEKFYIENSNGSLDLDLELFYVPQIYFYIGLIISLVTLFVLLLYISYFKIKSFYLRKK